MNTDQLTTRVADQLGAQQRLLVAFSGGLDSSVLLHVLAALRRRRQECNCARCMCITA